MTNKAKRAENVKMAYAINAIEGVSVPEEVKKIHEQWIDGTINTEKMIALSLQYCKEHCCN